MNPEHDPRVEIIAYYLWEEEGRPDGRHEQHWAEAERRIKVHQQEKPLSEQTEAGDGVSSSAIQDTPGRKKSTSSRQQTSRGQTSQTGSAALDSGWSSGKSA